MDIENTQYELAKTFPGLNFFSGYNFKVILHLSNLWPVLFFKGKHEFYRAMVAHILEKLSSIPDDEIQFCLNETLKTNKLALPKQLAYLETGFLYPMVLYYVIRILKPKVLVETGVHNGRSTSFILQALSDNKKGKLYSIDIGHDIVYDSESGVQDVIFPSNLEPGWLIPSNLKTKWEFIQGDSNKLLPELLNKLKTIDFFSHDGEHTDSAMLFEYEESYKYLTNNGILMSDDVLFGDDAIPLTGLLSDVPHYSSWLNFTKDFENNIINFRVGYMIKKI